MKRLAKTFLRILGWLIVMATFAMLAVQAWRFEPTRPGNSAEYWEYLCGAYPAINGQAYYFAQAHHEQILFSVPESEVLRDVPFVTEELKAPHPRQESSCTEYRSACEIYRRSAPQRAACSSQLTMDGLTVAMPQKLESLRVATKEKVHSAMDSSDADVAFLERMARGQHAWISVVFEALYIAMWLAFIAGLLHSA